MRTPTTNTIDELRAHAPDDSGGWQAEYAHRDVQSSIEPIELIDVCGHRGCDVTADLDICLILGGGRIEVRTACPEHYADVLEVSS